jgi:hypothetical protein
VRSLTELRATPEGVLLRGRQPGGPGVSIHSNPGG